MQTRSALEAWAANLARRRQVLVSRWIERESWEGMARLAHRLPLFWPWPLV